MKKMNKSTKQKKSTAKASASVFESFFKKEIPFLPDNYETMIPKLVKDGKDSKYRNPKFESILRMRQASLKVRCKDGLEAMGYKTVSDDGYVYGKGDLPVLLVAHLDTVHEKCPKDFVYKDHFLWSPQGIGGDDRCGVYMIFEIIKDLKCHVVFVEDEEVGCIGSAKFCRSEIARKISSGINFIIEFDRRNDHDAVYYSCANEKFEEFISGFGHFKTATGSYSDICEIAPAVGAAAVNLSCGYYNEHHKTEYIDLEAMHRNIEEAKRIIASCDENGRFEYVSRKQAFWDNDWYALSSCAFADDSYICADEHEDRNTQKEYLVYWNNYSYDETDGCPMETCVLAYSELEAVGAFMKEHRYVFYDDIEAVICMDDQL